jgi:hypothetical protein
MATTTNQFGITWTWTEDRTIGQFANGDWWVVGPITLTSVTRPNGNARWDGSMIGPTDLNTWGINAFDARMDNYVGYAEGIEYFGIPGSDITSGNGGGGYCVNLNIANFLPYSVPNGSSIISTISKTQYHGDAAPQEFRHQNQLQDQAILTVLASAPASGSFRPPYAGTNKTINWNKSDIDYTKFQNLAHIGTPPSLSSTAADFARPLIALGNSYCSAQYFGASNNAPNGSSQYGRDLAPYTGNAALLLNLNFTDEEKEPLAINFIQYGIDMYGVVQAGGAFPSAGGHTIGRKIALVVAGIALSSTEILSYAGGMNRWAENGSFFYINQRVVDEPRHGSTLDPPRTPEEEYWQEPYPSGSIGLCDWGGEGNGRTDKAGYNWGLKYRDVACQGMVGSALAVHIMDIRDEWANNYVPYGAYGGIHTDDNDAGAFMEHYFLTQRNGFTSYVNIDRNANPGGLGTWIMAMWDAYSGVIPPSPVDTPVITPASGSYELGRSATITCEVGASIHYTMDGTTPDNTDTTYSTAIPLLSSIALKAVGYIDPDLSNVATKNYTIDSSGKPAPPSNISIIAL